MKIDKDIELVFDDIIKKLYTEAKSTQTVVKYLKEKYGLEISRAYEIIKEAKIYFGEHINKIKVDSLNENLQIFENLRERALEQNNFKEARECTKEIAKLEQLYVERQEITHNVLPPLFPDVDYNKDNKED